MNNKKRNAVLIAIVVLILGMILNFLFEILPDNFKQSLTDFTLSIGLSYSLFWIICTVMIIVITLLFVWRQVLIEQTKSKNEKNAKPNKHVKREINQGKKSVYIEKHNGDIKIK